MVRIITQFSTAIRKQCCYNDGHDTDDTMLTQNPVWGLCSGVILLFAGAVDANLFIAGAGLDGTYGFMAVLAN